MSFIYSKLPPITNDEAAELCKRAQQGCDGSKWLLVRHVMAYCATHLRRNGIAEHDINDKLHDSIPYCLRLINKCDTRKNVLYYLAYAVRTNEGHKADKKARQQAHKDKYYEAYLDSITHTQPAVYDSEEDKGVIGFTLWTEVYGLPKQQSTAIVQRFMYGKTLAEIGEHMGITHQAARHNVERGLASLRNSEALKKLTQ